MLMNNIFNLNFIGNNSLFLKLFYSKIFNYIIHDLILVNSCLYLSYYLRLEYFYPFSEISKLFLLMNYYTVHCFIFLKLAINTSDFSCILLNYT